MSTQPQHPHLSSPQSGNTSFQDISNSTVDLGSIEEILNKRFQDAMTTSEVRYQKIMDRAEVRYEEMMARSEAWQQDVYERLERITRRHINKEGSQSETIAPEQKDRIRQELAKIKDLIKKGDTVSLYLHPYFHLEKESHIGWASFSPPSYEQKKIDSLEGLYRENWKEYDEEWQDYLIEKFRESTQGEHRFSILYFDPQLQKYTKKNPENIIGFMRSTRYKSDTDGYARYLGSVNIASGYRGYSFMKYLLKDYLDGAFLLSKEIYLHSIVDSDSEKMMRSLGFEDRGIEEIAYGHDKKMNLRLMCLTRATYKSISETYG